MVKSKSHLKAAVLAEIERHGVLARACLKFSITRQAVLKWRKSDPEFAALYRAALKRGRG